MKNNFINISILLLTVTLHSCKKEFLDKKPSKDLLVPTTLTDFQSLLDNSNEINTNSPYLSLIASDEFYSKNAALTGTNLNTYIWAADAYQGDPGTYDWDRPYRTIFVANVILEGLAKLDPPAADQALHRQLTGSALFLRGMSLYTVAQQFAPAYLEATADKEPGLPVHTNADVNARPGRGTIRRTYQQITDDLMRSIPLLPVNLPGYKTRPYQPAALAMLARVYLTMAKYDSAALYAQKALAMQHSLLDYNTLSSSSTNVDNPFPVPIPAANDEVIFYNVLLFNSFFFNSLTGVDTTLYDSYNAYDLRKIMFFNDRGSKRIDYKGKYSGDSYLFNGLAVDELYMIRAESYARLGKTTEALADLNTLMEKRWQTTHFVPFTATTARQALGIILTERRKELFGRGLRWSDLRRLNTDPEFATTLKHLFAGKTYTLPPGDNRYTFQIPDLEVAAGLSQNAR